MDKKLVITPAFRRRVEQTGMTQGALAKAIGVSRQFFNAVLNGKQEPTTAFMVGAIKAGLADQLSEIAVWATAREAERAEDHAA